MDAGARGHDTFCPVGPWIVTDLDPSDLEIRTEGASGIAGGGQCASAAGPR